LRRKLIFGLLVVPLGVLLVALAVVNRDPVSLTLDPFGGRDARLVVEAPLFLYLLGAFALGVAVGGVATWLGQAKWRRSARQGARAAGEWRRQAGRLDKERDGGHKLPAHRHLPAD
jgi:uncharacterized integral membrane protein